ncbi:MAG TPA: hypothetical protein VF121_16195 [Thermoanaerobaculia bacterium]|nr:hypothetical protein [Thermoanaerobaculia bacterium]
MAAKGHSFAERFARWQVLVDNLKDAEGLGHITGDHQQLEQQLVEARTLESRVEDLRSQARTLNSRMKKLANDGDALRSRLGANLQGKFGFTSETLIKYGFKPRRVPRRRPKNEGPVVAPPARSAQVGA